jgi:hypothetical protein
VVFVAYEFYQYRAGAPAGLPVAEATTAPDADAATPLAEATAAASDAPATALVAGKPNLAVEVTDTSWLRVQIDGKVAYEGTLRAPAAKSFSGKLADVRVGNAGGVRITVNGRALGPLGHSGDVVERRFVLTGE